MVFAIATFHTVLVYSTENLAPIYAMGNYHFASITELSWKDSSILGMSSSDGYCSFMVFEKD
jgi:chromatin assembly factor 1 subunit B